jgi:hypothetical protein
VYVPIQPCRVIDTRPGSGFTSNGTTLIPGNESLNTPDLHHVCGGQVPSTRAIDAVVLNVQAVNPSISGYLTLFGAGQGMPATSTLNFITGQTIANEATITTGESAGGTGYGGEVTILNYQGSVDVVVDVQGYYTADYGDGADLNDINPSDCYNESQITNDCGVYYPLSPQRVFDTRPASGFNGQNSTLGPQSQVSFFAGDEPFLPGGVLPVETVAVVLNVTAVNATQNTYLTVWGTGNPMPNTSNIDVPAGTTIPNRVIVPVGANGQVSIFNWSGNTNVVVDLNGYFNEHLQLVNDSGQSSYCTFPQASTCYGAFYFPLVTPQRISDTRAGTPYQNNGQTMGAGSIREVTIPIDTFGPYNPDPTDTNFAPSDFVAVDGNVTITNATGASYLTVYPANTVTGHPLASDLNWTGGEIISNGGLFSTGTGVPADSLQLYNYQNSVDSIFDLYGYYATSFKPGQVVDLETETCNTGINGTVSLNFDWDPVDTLPGGGPITYTVVVTDTTDGSGSQTVVTQGTQAVNSHDLEVRLLGLTSGNDLSITVQASNVDGSGPVSAPFVIPDLTGSSACATTPLDIDG